MDPFLLCLANAVDAAEHGAVILTHHALRAISMGAGGVRGVVLEDLLTSERREIGCRVVVNAAGPWAGEVAAQAGLQCQDSLEPRCARRDQGQARPGRRQPPEAAVGRRHHRAGGPACLVGTTSVPVTSPDDLEHSADEVRKLIAMGGELVPALGAARIMREFTGIRPLYGEGGAAAGRKVSRGFAVLDHAARDGLEGFVTVVGGKLTTYRLMAEQAADVAASKLGVDAPCTTAERVLPGSEPDAISWPEGMPRWMARALEFRHGSRAGSIAAGESDGGSRICMCECVPEAEIRFAVQRLFARTLDDLRRRTRLGMGPCQGSTCGPRAVALLAGEIGLDPRVADRMLGEFLKERDDGMLPVVRRGGAAQEEMNMSAGRGLAAGGGRDMSAHVVVIGGGAAGCAAAAAAGANGARVTIVSRGAGATALSTGAVTLDGVPDDAVLRTRVLDLLRSMVPLEGDGSARTYLSVSGAVIRAHLVGPTHAAGSLEDLNGRSVLVVGLRGLGCMNAADIARRLEMRGAKAGTALVDVPGIRQRFDLSSFSVAQALDDPALAAELAASVAREASKSGCDLVALPPVLGLRRAREAAKRHGRGARSAVVRAAFTAALRAGNEALQLLRRNT